jgi:hypothetical protein
MMLLVMGGKTAQLSVYSFSRANVIVLNLTHDGKIVQVSTVQRIFFSKNLFLKLYQ